MYSKTPSSEHLGSPGPIPSWLGHMVAFCRCGYAQTALVTISALTLVYQLYKTQVTAKNGTRVYKPRGAAFYEVLGHATRAITLGLFMTASYQLQGQGINALVIAYACFLDLLRSFGSSHYRKTLLGHIDSVLLSLFVIIVVAEGLPLMVAGRKYSMDQSMMTALISLFLSVCVSISVPHEWISPQEELHTSKTIEPTEEETCSWFDYCLTYSRANRIIREGSKSALNIQQLDKLPWSYDPETLRQKLAEIRKTQPSMKYALLRLLWPQLLLCTLMGILLYGAKLLSPMGLYSLLQFLQNPEAATFKPWLWLAVIFLGRIAQSVFEQTYASHSRKLATQVKGMLTADIYQSALASRELHGDFLNKKEDGGNGQQSTAAGIVENMVSTDINTVVSLREFLMCVTAAPAAVGAAIGLYGIVGWPSLLGIGLALLGSPFESRVLERVGAHEEQLKDAQDLRVSLASEYLRSIKIVKYFAWEDSIAKKIGEARAEEQKHIWAIDIFSTGLSLISDFFPILSLVIIFGLHVGANKIPLTAATAYTTIQLLEIIRDCLVFIALTRVDFSRAMVSLGRIDKFFSGLTPLDSYPHGPVAIEEATFQRAPGASFRLRDITIDFVQRGLNVLTGASGSGKSSLLLALLGETIKESGTVTRQEDVSFSSQTPWLQARTVRENIIFYNEYEEKRYQKVVKACCLDVDFAELPHGDETKIGEGGSSLSGGQRARVALARTLFSDASLLLLDDVFSALDTKTTLELWNGVFCSDLLRGRTAILVTQHNWMAAEANLAVEMQNGRVESVTRRDGLVRQPKAVQKSHQATKTEQVSEKSRDSQEKLTETETVEETTAPEQETSSGITGGASSVFQYLYYFGGVFVAALTLGMCALHVASDIYTTHWMSRWVERTEDDGSSMMFYLVVYILLSYLTQALDGARMMGFSRGIWMAARQLHGDLIHSVFASPLSWFSESTISEAMNRLSGDIGILDQSIYNSLVHVISTLIRCFLLLASVTWTLPVFAIPAVGLSVIGGYIARLYEGASRRLRQLVSSRQSPILSEFSEGMSGMAIIRATPTTSAVFYAKMNDLLCASSRANHAQVAASQWLKFRMSTLAASINTLAAVLALTRGDAISAGLAGFCLAQATQLSDKVLAVIFSFSSLGLDMQTFHRVQEYCQLKPEEDSPAGNDVPPVSESWPKTGSVELQNVTVRYEESGVDILKNVSLKIGAGERVAIVGRTGSGKSTLVLSLLGFTKVVGGRILYDGQDLTSIPRRRLRKAISTIPQEAQLFQGTVASNLDPSGTIPESDLQAALDVCQSILQSSGIFSEREKATVDEAPGNDAPNEKFSERLTLSTTVKSKGENFSHGQRQVLSLCRILVRRSQLVLLDEATSSMDRNTDAGVQRALRDELGSSSGNTRSVITVAHRLQTILDYDKIVVMGSGEILEMGSPKRLLQSKGAFYDMVLHSGEKDLIFNTVS